MSAEHGGHGGHDKPSELTRVPEALEHASKGAVSSAAAPVDAIGMFIRVGMGGPPRKPSSGGGHGH